MDFSKRAAENYKALSLIPSVDSGVLLEGRCALLKLSQTDVVNAKKRAYITTKTITGQHPPYQVASLPFPCDLTNVTMFAPSPSGKQLGLVRVDESKKDEPYIEVVVCSYAYHLVF